MQGWSGSYRGRVGWVMQQNNLKNDSPQNQDFTSLKSFWKGYNAFYQSNYQKNMPSLTLSRKQLTIFFVKKRQNT